MKRALVCFLLLFASPAWPGHGVDHETDSLMPWLDGGGPPPLDPGDAAWIRAPATAVTLYPQATAPGGPGGGTVKLDARLMAGGGRLAIRLAWTDATEDRVDAKASHHFADAVAVQFAPKGATLPYVGMGEPGRPARLWFWRAGGPAERLMAQGFGSLAKEVGAAPEAHAIRTATGWAVVLRGEFDAPAAVAFAAWDGAEDGRAGRKRLSAWRALAQPSVDMDAGLLGEIRSTGNPSRGAGLYAEHGCAACHAPMNGPHVRNSGSLPTQKADAGFVSAEAQTTPLPPEGAQSPVWGGPAPGMGANLAPDLAHAGGIHRPGYLRRSILEPAAFLVPGYAAIMPALPLKPEDVEDLVAYLMTLR